MTGATYSFGVPCGGQASKGHATRSERLDLTQGARKIGGEPHIMASGTETAGASHSIARAVPAECAHGTHSVSRSPAIFRGLPQRAPGLRRWSVADLVWGRLTKRGLLKNIVTSGEELLPWGCHGESGRLFSSERSSGSPDRQGRHPRCNDQQAHCLTCLFDVYCGHFPRI